MKLIVEGLEEGQVLVIAVVPFDGGYEEEPDPGEEEPEEEIREAVKLVGKVINL